MILTEFNKSYVFWISSALFAAMVWSTNFIVPFVIDGYTFFDFALLRFFIYGCVGAAILLCQWRRVRGLKIRDWFVAAFLAFVGYVGYFLLVAGAAVHAGPVIAPAFLGTVPVVLAIAGNLHKNSVPWRLLSVPLIAITFGLALVNAEALAGAGGAVQPSLFLGIALAIGAVAFWTWFGLANQAALAIRPGMDSGLWTALILVGGAVEMLIFYPVGLKIGVFNLPRLGMGWDSAAMLYFWGSSLAILSSVGGAWAWTIAARHLPVALSAQLIVSETAFGVVFGLAVHGRWATWAETIGLVCLLAGVLVAIRNFYQMREKI